MKRAFQKNIFRTIKKSMGRYMAIFAIIALGVGFFTGLKVSKPSMIKTGQEYIREEKLFDYRLISTWGFDEEEIAQLQALDGVAAEGAYWEDFIYTDSEGTEKCLKALSITEQVNTLTLTAGRMPQKADECVLDAYYYPESMIGQTIGISEDNSQETRDSFVYEGYTVTGLVRSPLYMNMERGTTTVGNGKIESFIYIPLEGFSYDYFKEAYVYGDIEALAFTQAYEDEIQGRTDNLEADTTVIIEARYRQEIDDAKAEIDDAKKELKEKTQEAELELADAKQELEDGEAELADGKKQLEDAWNTLTQKEQELADGETALTEGENQYQQGLAEYQAGQAEYESGAVRLEENRAMYEQAKVQIAQLEAAGLGDALLQNEAYLMLTQTVAAFEANEQQLIQAGAELASAKAVLDASAVQLEESRAEIEDGKARIADGKKELRDAQKEIEESQEKLKDGWQEYEEGVAKLEQETEDAQKKIADAQEELADVEEPEVYVLDRNTNVGYACFESDVSIVEGVAKIFPLFFFLIAALVCSTTMTRMVDDERTQIGTLRALGYTEGAVFAKYLLYSGSAAGLGAAAGYFLGGRLFPRAIWTAYNMLYGFADIIIVDSAALLLISLAVAFLCSAGTTLGACWLELKHTPADLIRPKAPSAGKRILLERIGILWRHLKFLHKVSARNIFRFKKRMIMMILGISGCMALVVTGFGVKDSVSNIVNNQYDQILKYDISATYTEEITETMLTKIAEEFDGQLLAGTVLLQTSVDAFYQGGAKTVTLMASDDENMSRCVDFHLDGVPVDVPGKGEILIDNRLAQVMDVEIGDEITLTAGETETKPLKVAGIFENYTFYYAYVTGETYQEYFGEAYEPKTLYLSLGEEGDAYQIASYLSDMVHASDISVIADMRARVENTMSSMNYVVALVIGCAGALAFIVLFNLGNINISERVREIATLKVLGFYSRETGSYVFRESIVLSVMGMVLGIPLGVVLHRFVMSQIKIDMVSFDVHILPRSYLYSVLAVLGFTVCVDLIMRRKISGINMAESLKSIE